MSDLYRRVVVDGVEVRAVKAGYKPGHGARIKSRYPIMVAGESRGWLCYQVPGWHDRGHRGWMIYSHSGVDQWPLGRSEATTHAEDAKEATTALLTQVPLLIAAGRLPTPPEAKEAERRYREAQAEGERQRAADDAERKARNEREYAALVERWGEMMLGLRDLQARDDLTNLQRVGLERAIERLRQSSPAGYSEPAPDGAT